MKSVVVVLALVASALALVNPIYKEWEDWKRQYNPRYASNEEHSKRFEIFAKNKRQVLELNKMYADKPDGARFALNQYADLTNEEFVQMYLSPVSRDMTHLDQLQVSKDDYPDKKDWRKEGAVNGVTDQDSCGSPSDASLGNMEGVYKVANGELPVLSRQQLYECNNGCHNPSIPDTLAYAVRQGMNSKADYPDSGMIGTCKFSSTHVYGFSRYFQIPPNEDGLVAALNKQGPIVAGVDASQWQFYTGGIFDGNCTKKINHAVLIVGYDSIVVSGQEEKYWIIRNSWGKVWGENGYIRLIRDQDECGVNDFVFTIVA